MLFTIADADGTGVLEAGHQKCTAQPDGSLNTGAL